MGFTKLSSSLIASSIWNEPDKVRIVWITMLAMADQNGDVKASVVGLAYQARESLPDTEHALAILAAPDPHSGRKEMEGRRVVEIESGWHLVTHEFYREIGMSEEVKRYWRDRQRKSRMSRTVKDKSCKSRKRGNGNASASVPVFKSSLDKLKEGVRGRFEEWILVRKQMGKAPKDWTRMFNAQIDWLLEFPEKMQAEIVSQSIRNNWQGLFEPKGKSNGAHQNRSGESGRGVGTSNEGKSSQYAGVGKISSVPNPQRSAT